MLRIRDVYPGSRIEIRIFFHPGFNNSKKEDGYKNLLYYKFSKTIFFRLKFFFSEGGRQYCESVEGQLESAWKKSPCFRIIVHSNFEGLIGVIKSQITQATWVLGPIQTRNFRPVLRIRDPALFWPLDQESGSGIWDRKKNRIRIWYPGWTSQIIFPRAWKQSFG